VEDESLEEECRPEIIVPDQAQAPFYGVECPCGHITFAGAVTVGPGEPVFHTLIKQIGCEKCGTIVMVQPRNVYWRDSDPSRPIRTLPFYRRHFWRIEYARLWLIWRYWDALAILGKLLLKYWNASLYAFIAVLVVIEKSLRKRRRSTWPSRNVKGPVE